jgi:enamine deaminase RidA (YjgF/YER057c/UK114 family)
MTITRHGITQATEGLPVIPVVPIISRVVVRGDTVYVCGVTANPFGTGDIRTQTKEVLETIDRLLQTAGTDKSNLLTAQVWLSDMSLFEAHNAVWNEWVDHRNPPVRACVRADLWDPNLLVEIMVTAAK